MSSFSVWQIDLLRRRYGSAVQIGERRAFVVRRETNPFAGSPYWMVTLTEVNPDNARHIQHFTGTGVTLRDAFADAGHRRNERRQPTHLPDPVWSIMYGDLDDDNDEKGDVWDTCPYADEDPRADRWYRRRSQFFRDEALAMEH